MEEVKLLQTIQKLQKDVAILQQAVEMIPDIPKDNESLTRRILVVDDEPQLRKIMSRMLAGDFEVCTVKDGKEALNLLETDSEFDAVVTDEHERGER